MTPNLSALALAASMANLTWRKQLSYAMNKAMRHDVRLPRNSAGLCYLDDLAVLLPVGNNGLPRRPTLLEMMYTVHLEKEGRFEGTSVFGCWPPMKYDVLARCIQGHSVDHIDDAEAHVPYTAATAGDSLLIHYTNDKVLDRILGYGGLIPGGGVKRRNHVFISRKRVSDTGVIPDGFTKRGINIGIVLDSTAMLEAGVPLFLTRANTVLCPQLIESRFFTAVKYVSEPRITLYKRPTTAQMARTLTAVCKCPYCEHEHFQGTQVCLGNCWVPITLDGVQDHMQFLLDRNTRTKELLEVYGLTHKELQRLIDESPASALEAHSLAMNRPHTADPAPAAPKRQRTAATEPSSVAAAAVAMPSAEAGAGNRGPTRRPKRPTDVPDVAAVSAEAAPSPPYWGPAPGFLVYGDPAVRGPCSHMKDKDVYDKQKGALKRTDEFGYAYSGHSDRWRRDPTYRNDCERHVPPTPEILYFVSGKLCE